MSVKKLKIGVVGIGSMGINHVRVYKECKDVDEVYIFDTDEEKAIKYAKQFNAKSVSSLDGLLICDAISIAAPTSLHKKIGAFFIQAGKHCLIEKPLASTQEEAMELTKLALDQNVILMVGHIEHFNPVFLQLNKILNRENVEIYSIDSKRLSYARNGLDKTVDVIFDLMVHDIGLISTLIRSDFKKISAHHVVGNDPWGHVTALCTSNAGVIVNLTASRITQNKVRTMTLDTNLGFFHLDFLTQEMFLNKSGLIKNDVYTDDSIYTLDMSIDKIFIRHEEPLKLELTHFISCIINNTPPLVNGDLATKFIDMAERIQKVAV